MSNDLKHHFFPKAHHSRQYSLLESEVQSVILMIISHLILHSILICKKLIVHEVHGLFWYSVHVWSFFGPRFHSLGKVVIVLIIF